MQQIGQRVFVVACTSSAVDRCLLQIILLTATATTRLRPPTTLMQVFEIQSYNGSLYLGTEAIAADMRF